MPISLHTLQNSKEKKRVGVVFQYKIVKYKGVYFPQFPKEIELVEMYLHSKFQIQKFFHQATKSI